MPHIKTGKALNFRQTQRNQSKSDNKYDRKQFNNSIKTISHGTSSSFASTAGLSAQQILILTLCVGLVTPSMTVSPSSSRSRSNNINNKINSIPHSTALKNTEQTLITHNNHSNDTSTPLLNSPLKGYKRVENIKNQEKFENSHLASSIKLSNKQKWIVGVRDDCLGALVTPKHAIVPKTCLYSNNSLPIHVNSVWGARRITKIANNPRTLPLPTLSLVELETALPIAQKKLPGFSNKALCKKNQQTTKAGRKLQTQVCPNRVSIESKEPIEYHELPVHCKKSPKKIKKIHVMSINRKKCIRNKSQLGNPIFLRHKKKIKLIGMSTSTKNDTGALHYIYSYFNEKNNTKFFKPSIKTLKQRNRKMYKNKKVYLGKCYLRLLRV